MEISTLDQATSLKSFTFSKSCIITKISYCLRSKFRNTDHGIQLKCMDVGELFEIEAPVRSGPGTVRVITRPHVMLLVVVVVLCPTYTQGTHTYINIQ